VGIVTKLTVKTHPDPKVWFTSITLNQTAATDEIFWNAATAYYTAQPAISDRGISGSVVIGEVVPGSGGPLQMHFTLFSFEPTPDAFDQLLTPLVKMYQSAAFIDGVSASMTKPIRIDSAMELYDHIAPLPFSTSFTTSSRLLDRDAMLSDSDTLIKKLNESRSTGNVGPGAGLLVGLQVSGPAVRAGSVDATAVTPAWRKTYLHQGTA
jgi:hypothetical protein